MPEPRVVYDAKATILQPYGVEVLFGRQEDPLEPDPLKWKIVDIQVPLTNEEYSDLILHFNDKHNSWESSCYTYIVQNELANYEQWYDANYHKMDREEAENEEKVHHFMGVLRSCTELYAPLEALINSHPTAEGDSIPDLLLALDNLRKGLEKKLLAENIAPELTKQLLEEIDQFTYEAQRIQRTFPRDREAIKHLFSLSREKSNQPCLGYFLSQNLFELADVGRKQLNVITDKDERGKVYNRLRNQFETPYSQNRLSDAKSQIERKRSAYGTEFNSNRAAVPVEMLAALRPQPNEYVQDTNGQPVAVKRWTSLNRYLKRLDDREDVDAILRHVGKKNAYNGPTPGLRWAPLVMGATLIEVGQTLIRTGLAIVAGVIGFTVRDVIYNPISFGISRLRYWGSRAVNAISGDADGTKRKALDLWLENEDEARSDNYDAISESMEAFDEGLSTLHRDTSLVRIAKARRDSVYNTNEIKNLNGIMGPQESYFQVTMDLFPGSVFANYARDTISSFYNSIASFPDTITTLGRHVYNRLFSADYRRSVYVKYRDKANDRLLEQFQKLFEAAEQEEEKKAAAAAASGVAQPLEDNSNGLGKYPLRNSVRDMQTPHVESFMHFAQSIAVVLGDEIFDSVFRKSPGISTLAFMASCASFGILLAPGSAPAIAAFSESFAKATMGKEAGGAANSTMIMNNMFTAVLQFKVLFVGMEVIKGDVKVLKDIFKNPEEVTLAFCIASAAGIAMSYLPVLPKSITNIHLGLSGQSIDLPNVYGEGLNLFINEALECAKHGTWGATSLEFSFLSMKLGFLIESLGAGLHYPSHITSPILDEMHAEYRAIAGKKPATYKEIEMHFHPLLDAHKLEAHDKQILLQQFHHSLVLNKIFSTYKTSTHEAFALANPLYVAWSKSDKATRGKAPSVVAYDANIFKPNSELTDEFKTKLLVIFNEHGIDAKDQKHFTDAFIQSLKSAKEQAELSTTGILSRQTNIVDALKDDSIHDTPRDRLMKIFRLVRNLELSGTPIESSFEKNTLYDMVYDSIEEYNQSMREAGHPDLEFDGTEFKESFYNKFVHRGSNNFVRSVQLLLLFPFTVGWRLLQRGFAYALDAAGMPSHSLHHKLNKSWEKDKFIFYQTIFMTGRLGQSAMRAITYGIIRIAVLALPVAVATVITSPLLAVNLAVSAIAIGVGGIAAVFAPLFTGDLSGSRAAIKSTRDFVANTWNPTKNTLTSLMKPVWEFFVAPAIDAANWFRPYKNITFPAFMRAEYASAIQKADMKNADLRKLSETGLAQLERNEDILAGRAQKIVQKPGKDYQLKHESTSNGWLPSFSKESQSAKKNESTLLVHYHRELRALDQKYSDTLNKEPTLKTDNAVQKVKKLLDDLEKYPPKTENQLKTYIAMIGRAEESLKQVKQQKGLAP